MASTERIHGQSASGGRESRWDLQNVVHQFQHRQESLLWRKVSRTQAERTPPLHGQVRRSESAWRDSSDDRLETGLLRHGVEHHAGRHPRGDSLRGVLHGLAGIADAAGKTGRGGNTRSAVKEFQVEREVERALALNFLAAILRQPIPWAIVSGQPGK